MAQQTTVHGFRELSAREQMTEQGQGAGPAPRSRLSLRPVSAAYLLSAGLPTGPTQHSQQEAGFAAR